jgi:recombination protein RecT
MELVKSFLTNPQIIEQLRLACAKHVSAERFARVAMTAALRTPKLQQCFTTPEGKLSIMEALLKSAARGLEVDGRQAHLVPFNCKQPDGTYKMQAQFLPGYQGLLDLCYNHPHVGAVWVEPVFAKDTFRHTLGLNPNIEHERYVGEDDAGPVVAVYAVCRMKTGETVSKVLYNRDINKIRAFSRGASEPDSIWNTHTAAMWSKSAIRALCKIIPQSAELRDVLSDDEEFEQGKTIDISSVQVPRARIASESMALDVLQAPPAPATAQGKLQAPPPARADDSNAELNPATPPATDPFAAPKRRGRPQKLAPAAPAAPHASPEPPPAAETPAEPQGGLQDGLSETQLNFQAVVNNLEREFPMMTWEMVRDWFSAQGEFGSLDFGETQGVHDLSDHVCRIAIGKAANLRAWIGSEFAPKQPKAAPSAASTPPKAAPSAAPEPRESPHMALHRIVTECGKTFEDYKQLVIECGWLPADNQSNSFASLPPEHANRMSANAQVIVALFKQADDAGAS